MTPSDEAESIYIGVNMHMKTHFLKGLLSAVLSLSITPAVYAGIINLDFGNHVPRRLSEN